VLPDDVLLKIFDLSGLDYKYSLQFAWKWYFLVHVCQRWRQIVFASPHRLNLRILCSYRTPVRKNLDIWPAFPIIVDYGDLKSIVPYDEDDLLAALEHPDRVCSVNLRTTPPQLEQMVRIMQEPFPVLTDLKIILYDAENFPALPRIFWEDLHRHYNPSIYAAFPFQHCQGFLCQLVTSSSSPSTI
jgi:hypothetical protein